jgi:hypothetical protein
VFQAALATVGAAAYLVPASGVEAGGARAIILDPGQSVRIPSLPWACGSTGNAGQEIEITCNAESGPEVVLKSTIASIDVITYSPPRVVVEPNSRQRTWVFPFPPPVAAALLGPERTLRRGDTLSFAGLPAWHCSYSESSGEFMCVRGEDALAVVSHPFRVTTNRPLAVTQLPQQARLYFWL